IVRAHQHAAGARGGQAGEALGRRRGGFSTKMPLRAHRQGRPPGLPVTPRAPPDQTVFGPPPGHGPAEPRPPARPPPPPAPPLPAAVPHAVAHAAGRATKPIGAGVYAPGCVGTACGLRSHASAPRAAVAPATGRSTASVIGWSGGSALGSSSSAASPRATRSAPSTTWRWGPWPPWCYGSDGEDAPASACTV